MKHIKLFENKQENTLKYITRDYTTIDIERLKECLSSVENSEYFLNELETYLGNRSQNDSPQRAAHLIEQNSKIKNIKGMWVYPYDIDYALNEFLIICVSDGDDLEMKRLYMDYLLLNPEMKNFTPKTYGDVYYILMGMTSGYNFNDINSFLTKPGYKLTSEDRRKISRIEQEIGMELQYIPSVETIAEMEKQLGL